MTSHFLVPDLRSVFTVDLRGLALFRIALGFILLADLVIRVPELGFWLVIREWRPESGSFNGIMTGVSRCTLPMVIGCGRRF